MNSFIFTFILLFFSVVADVLLSKLGMIFSVTSIAVFYLAISRHSGIVFPLVCITGVMLDSLLLYPYMLNSVFLLIVATVGVLWLINGEFSYGSLPHATVIAFLSSIFIIVCYSIGIVKGLVSFDVKLFIDILLNIFFNLCSCYILFPLLVNYGDKIAVALSIDTFSVARDNYIQKRKEM